MLLKMIRRLLLSRRVRIHMRLLERACVIGAELNSAPWQKPGAIMNLMVGNKSVNPSNIVIGDYCNLSLEIHCERKGRISIGHHVFMSARTFLRCDHEITIGSFCMFGPNVRIYDTRNHPFSPARRKEQARAICSGTVDSYEAGGAPVIIEDNVWLGMNVIVLEGVRIGQGSVVGAGSVVTRDIPPNSFAAGVPARIIRSIAD